MAMKRLLIALASAGCFFAGGAVGQEGRPTKPLPLKVVGTQLRDSTGKPVRLRGVNTASMEWTSNGEDHILDTVKTAITDWHANTIRLPLSQDRWYGKAPEQTDKGKFYRILVRRIVDAVAGEGCHIILDLHWSNAGDWGKNIGQHFMPDENSLRFWKDVAEAYKNHPAVLFNLYNEPHNVGWDIWLNGGQVTEKATRKTPVKTYKAVGMQALLDAVRSTGAENVVIVGGLNWSYDFSGILKGSRLSDPSGNGVLYDNHAYPFKGDTVERWIAKMETAAQTLPIIVGEFGAETRRGAVVEKDEQWVRQVLQALEDHEWNWTAWDMHPAAGPRLIVNFRCEPTPGFGKWVKQALDGTLPPYALPQSKSGTRGGTGATAK
jgi:endoglucanase